MPDDHKERAVAYAKQRALRDVITEVLDPLFDKVDTRAVLQAWYYKESAAAAFLTWAERDAQVPAAARPALLYLLRNRQSAFAGWNPYFDQLADKAAAALLDAGIVATAEEIAAELAAALEARNA